MAILELKGLRKQFGKLVAVDSIDLSIEEGEIRGLIGPNGSGKTTLFNLITGFLQPTKGRVIWQGRDITRKPTHFIVNNGLARTFQLSILFEEMTVMQNVLIACNMHTGTGLLQQLLRIVWKQKKEKTAEKKAMSALETMGISDVKDELAGKLPLGHQRALGIAIALATDPKLLLLDEPLTGMNPTETRDMMERIKMLRDKGITILLVEHDMKAVMTTCEKITVMNFGEKIAEGSPEEISKNEEVIEAYLGREKSYA